MRGREIEDGTEAEAAEAGLRPQEQGEAGHSLLYSVGASIALHLVVLALLLPHLDSAGEDIGPEMATSFSVAFATTAAASDSVPAAPAVTATTEVAPSEQVQTEQVQTDQTPPEPTLAEAPPRDPPPLPEAQPEPAPPDQAEAPVAPPSPPETPTAALAMAEPPAAPPLPRRPNQPAAMAPAPAAEMAPAAEALPTAEPVPATQQASLLPPDPTLVEVAPLTAPLADEVAPLLPVEMLATAGPADTPEPTLAETELLPDPGPPEALPDLASPDLAAPAETPLAETLPVELQPIPVALATPTPPPEIAPPKESPAAAVPVPAPKESPPTTRSGPPEPPPVVAKTKDSTAAKEQPAKSGGTTAQAATTELAAAETTPAPDPNPAPTDIKSPPVKLSPAEIDAFKGQLRRYWVAPASVREIVGLKAKLRIVINPDRTPSEVTVVDLDRYNSDGRYRLLADSAIKAVWAAGRTQFNLPPDKYDTWSVLTVTFDLAKDGQWSTSSSSSSPSPVRANTLATTALDDPQGPAGR